MGLTTAASLSFFEGLYGSVGLKTAARLSISEGLDGSGADQQ